MCEYMQACAARLWGVSCKRSRTGNCIRRHACGCWRRLRLGGDAREGMAAAQVLHEGALKLLGEALDDCGCRKQGPRLAEATPVLGRVQTQQQPASSGTSVGGLPEHHHLALVGLAGEVALEAILVAALLLAHLTIPAQLLQALGLDAIGNLQHIPSHFSIAMLRILPSAEEVHSKVTLFPGPPSFPLQHSPPSGTENHSSPCCSSRSAP